MVEDDQPGLAPGGAAAAVHQVGLEGAPEAFPVGNLCKSNLNGLEAEGSEGHAT